MTKRSEHIAGLRLNRITPADIEVFFRLLPKRMPSRTVPELDEVLATARHRVVQLAIDLGSVAARSIDEAQIEATSDLVLDQIAQMRRRDWRSRIDGSKTIDHVRREVGEISADLHELAGG